MNIWNELDNYLLIIAAFLSALAAGLNDPRLALGILATGMILKAIGSSIDPAYQWYQNLDNLALALAGVASVLVTLLAPNTTLTVAVMIAGFALKTIGSAYVKGADVPTNVDNIILAITVVISTVLISFGYAQGAFYVTTAGAFLKALLSAYLRENTPTPTPAPTPTPVPAPAAT